MIRLLLSVLLFLTIHNLQAQTVIQGTISNQHNEPIPYSAMGIKNSRVAALANENGSYRLVVPDSLQHKPIIFSAMGHIERSMTVIELKNNSNVVLEEKIQTLTEVVIE